jgi:hypothetical protein
MGTDRVFEGKEGSTGRDRIMAADSMSVPDYYARLGVDPGAARAEIEAALKRMQPAWSMGTRNPKTRHANQLYLDEIPALRRALLSDDTSRAAYDAELAMVQVAEREIKLDELQRRVRLRAAKGGLSPTDRRILGDEAQKLGLTEDDLLRATRPIPTLVEAASLDEDAELDQDSPADVLDPSTRRQIRVALEHLACRDLYDALGVARDAPGTYIVSRADAERQRWMKKAQVTAEKTAWLEVITHAQSHLSSSRARARYDRTLAQEMEESFEGMAAFALKGLRRMDPGTQAVLIEEAAAVGIAAERADRLIGRICRRLGVARDHGAVTPHAPGSSAPQATGGLAEKNGAAKFSLLRCRHCAGVTELSPVARKAPSARCRHCGASLKWACPICKQNLWVDERRCGCGFRQAHCEPLVRHFEAAQNAFRNFDLARALEHLERVQQFAPHLAGARNGILKVRQRQAEIERVRLAYHTARAGGRLASARAAVEAWSRLVDPASPDLQAAWSELGQSLRRAEALAARARETERTDPATARAIYRQSLALAADLPEALAGLKRTPADPPTALDAEVMGDRIRLSWTPAPPDGLGPLTFVVVRKRGGALQHPADGTRIAEVSTTEFDDVHVAPGETVGYAVLSKRGGVESIAAISLGPFVFLADVKDVRVEFRHQEVELGWSLPRGVTEVRVIRKRGEPPKTPRDGDRIPAALDHVLDRNLDPDEIYYYAIYAIYSMADGRLFPAPGVVVSARPQPPITPLEAPRLVQEPNGRVRIDWLEPARGSVKILRTAGPLLLAAGARLVNAEALALEGQWLEAAGPDRGYDPDPPVGGHCYYTPFTIWGESWTVGQSVALSRVADPTDLRATRVGSGLGALPGSIRLTLRWRWAAGAAASLVMARQGSPPQGPDDPTAIAATVSRADYDARDCWTLNLPMGRGGGGSVVGAVGLKTGPDGGNSRPSPEGGSNHTATAAPLPAPPGANFSPSDSGPWYIRVYSVIDLDGVRSVSPGLDSSAATIVPGPHPEVTISYSLKRPWLPGFSWSVGFRTEPAGAVVPPMVLVAHPRTVPLSVDDGQIVAHFPSGHDGAHFPIRTSLKLSEYGARVFPDPNVEPDGLQPIRLRHPETGATRV